MSYQEVESGDAPDIEGTETLYKFGYLTIVVSSAQRLQIPNPCTLKSSNISYLVARLWTSQISPDTPPYPTEL